MRAIAFFLAYGGLILHAQDTGWITGSVTDPTGAAVPKATVNLMLHGGTKAVATTVTTAQGLFTLQTLRPVNYDLTADAAGFQRYKLDNVKVDPSRPTDIPVIKLVLATAATFHQRDRGTRNRPDHLARDLDHCDGGADRAAAGGRPQSPGVYQHSSGRVA